MAAEPVPSRLALPDPPLRCGPVVLRELTVADAPAFAAAVSSPEILHFAFGDQLPLHRVRVAREFIGVRLPAMLELERAAMLGVCDAEREELVGATLLSNVDLDAGHAEVGCWLAAEARGRGLAGAATRATCDWAFGTLGLHRLQALTDARNAAAARGLRRLGFMYEGVLRGLHKTPAGYRDCLSWSLLATDVA